MTDRLCRVLPLVLLLKIAPALRGGAMLCAVLASACGPSAQELQLRSAVHELDAEVREQRQHNLDLKHRLRLADARNKVLIALVQELTRSARGKDASAGAGAAAQPSLSTLDADLRALVASVHHSQQDIAATSAQRDAMADELTHARAVVAVAQTEQAKDSARAEAYAALREQLAALIAHGELEVHMVDQRMVLSITDVRLFARDEATVLPSAAALLDRVAQALASTPGRDMQIAAHSDGRPLRKQRFPDKWRLSAERALNVLLYLTDHGVPRERLSAAAYADTRPAIEVTTEAEQYRNGRIEIVLLPNPNELPDLSHLEQ